MFQLVQQDMMHGWQYWEMDGQKWNNNELKYNKHNKWENI
jgi:hypothetical protein